MAIADYFSQNYSEARTKFLAAARDYGGDVTTLLNPVAKGPEGESLATDMARFGPKDAELLLITCSATHGVEGFCGSGAQIASIDEGLLKQLPKNCAFVMVHAINPYGFAHLRRVNEDNVDLNRNFIDHAKPHPASPEYEQVHPWVLPADWDGPARAEADKAIADFIATQSLSDFQAALSGGQYTHPDGVFYGGQKPVWSNLTFQEIVKVQCKGKKRIGFIDFHTGLGPSGYGEPIYVGAPEGPGFKRARDWFGPDVTSPEAGTSTSAVVQGTLRNALDWLAPEDAEVTAIALEYGTLSVPEVLGALRADNWLYQRGGGDINSDIGKTIKRQIRDAFYVDTDEWKRKIYDRAAEMTERAMKAVVR